MEFSCVAVPHDKFKRQNVSHKLIYIMLIINGIHACSPMLLKISRNCWWPWNTLTKKNNKNYPANVLNQSINKSCIQFTLSIIWLEIDDK